MKEITLLAPTSGEVVALAKTDDRVFASGAMGEGFGLVPSESRVLAPVTGKVTLVAETKHAIGITTKTGLEVLVHMGIDTVDLAGRPFNVNVKVGHEVTAGTKVAQMDLAAIEKAGRQTTLLVLVTNAAAKLAGIDVQQGTIKAGEKVATGFLKDSQAAVTGAKLSDSDLAKLIIEQVGGPDNIKNVIHCITRLRFYLKDWHRANSEVLKHTRRILEVRYDKAQGQYQVVIGTEVAGVFDAIMAQLGDRPESAEEPAVKSKGITAAFGNLIGFITGAMSPVIGVIAASGIIKGLLALLSLPQLGTLVLPTSRFYLTVSAIADSAFFFLPILVGFAAAKRLNGDPIVAAVIGGVLTYPQLITWGKSYTTMFSIAGFKFQYLNYTYSIFPMILAAWLAKKVSDWLKQWLPSYLQMIFNPLLTVLVVSAITLVVTGPIIQGFANGIANLINWLVGVSGWAGGLVIGGFYQVLVIFGLHWGVVPLVAQQIAGSGQSSLNAIISSTMVAQGAAVLAVAVKSHQADTKELGFAAAISAFCGVTEPAIYGVNLRFRKVFISGLVGSAAGGLITGLMHGSMYGFTGSLIGFSSFFNPKNPAQLTSFYAFLLSSLVTIIISFTLTYLWGYNDQMKPGEPVLKKARPGQA